MRICIDLDGTICETRKSYESYTNVKPIKNAIVAIKSLKKKGHTIIIYTSRHMKTCNNNIGRITALQGKIIFDWLDKHQIPYDEINFGKPLADIYIDDKSVQFTSWEKVLNKVKK